MTADGTLYAGENDNIYRSSYLWEIKVGDYWIVFNTYQGKIK